MLRITELNARLAGSQKKEPEVEYESVSAKARLHQHESKQQCYEMPLYRLQGLAAALRAALVKDCNCMVCRLKFSKA